MSTTFLEGSMAVHIKELKIAYALWFNNSASETLSWGNDNGCTKTVLQGFL